MRSRNFSDTYRSTLVIVEYSYELHDGMGVVIDSLEMVNKSIAHYYYNKQNRIDIALYKI
jgi:hypothetical protein